MCYGYCDFNTYTNLATRQGTSAEDLAGTLVGELRATHHAMDSVDLPAHAAQTVFADGEAPTMLPAADLVSILELMYERFGPAADVEVTMEADPSSMDEVGLETPAEGGFIRISFGMQSAVPYVLRILGRTHEPVRVSRVVEWARRAGLSTSLNLIYGAPGESLEDRQRFLDMVARIGPDHVSAYVLIIGRGTCMWGQARHGELSMPKDDDEVTEYEMVDVTLGQAGYEYYEISNWVRPSPECRYDQTHWLDWDWWGVGPRAHPHLGGMRLWGAKHPVTWAGQIVIGHLPMAGHEVIDAESRELERIMLGAQLHEGTELASLRNRSDCPSADRPDKGRVTPPYLMPIMAGLVGDGLPDAGVASGGQAILTLHGRLMADTTTRALIQRVRNRSETLVDQDFDLQSKEL